MKQKILVLGAFLLAGGIALLFWFGYPPGLNKENNISTKDAMAERSDKEKVAQNSINNNCSCELVKFLGVDAPTMGAQKLTSGRFFKIVGRDYDRQNKKRLTEISVTFVGNLAIVFPQDFEGAQIGEVRRNSGNGEIIIYRKMGKKWEHIASFADASAVGISKYYDHVSQMPIIAVYESTWSEGGTYSIYEWRDNSDEYQVLMSGIYTDAGEINFTDCTRVVE